MTAIDHLSAPNAAIVAHNLRRLMAQANLTIGELARRSALDDRTIKALLAARNARPHARTLHHLASGLGVSTDELFHSASYVERRRFDRQTNTVVDEVVAAHPRFFADWTAADFDELYSQVGTGGALTSEGALVAAVAINRKRDVHDKLSLILETDQAELIASIVELLYDQVRVRA